MSDLLQIAEVFLRIGLVAFGGSNAVLPELERVLVDERGWLTRREFVDSFALGQLTPGPALLMVMFAGYRVAGLAGAGAALLAMFLPSALMSTLVAANWDRFRHSPWLAALQRACAGLAIGLLVAGAFTVCKIAIVDLETVGIAAVALLGLLRWRLSPTVVILAGGFLAAALAVART